jgi:hypothetical protein
MQPKNHATPWDKKKSCNLSRQKKNKHNHSGQNKITQPFGTEQPIDWDKKNPAYGRQSISRPMRIVAPMP